MPKTPTSPKTSADKDRDTHLEEWKRAQDVLHFFDDKLHDLRKYGFTFVTVLLTAEGILIPKIGVDVDNQIKFGIFLVTLLLILALHLIDQNYRVFLRAANMRALVLERELNLELSDTITDRHKAENVNRNVTILYILFIFAVLLSSCFSIKPMSVYPNWLYCAALGAVALVLILLTLLLNTSFKYGYKEDWAISPLKCTPKDKVTITLTNMNQKTIKLTKLKDAQKRLQKRLKITSLDTKLDDDFKELKNELSNSDLKKRRVREPIIFQKDKLRWEIIAEEGGTSVAKAPTNKELHVYDSHTWIWDISKVEIKKGAYQLRPRGWHLPLHRRIIVSENTEEKTKEKGEVAGN